MARHNFYPDMINTLKQYSQPYAEMGGRMGPQLEGQYGQMTGHLPNLEDQYQQLMNNPGALYERLAGGYHESPGFRNRMKEGENSSLNAMAAGGMAGSPMHQDYAARTSEHIADEDFNNYMQQMMSMYGIGLGGEQGLYNRGEEGQRYLYGKGQEAGTGLGENITSLLARLQQEQFMKEQGKKQRNTDLWTGGMNMVGGIGRGIGAFMGGM